MFEIQIPFPMRGVPTKPELTGPVKVDETMIQALASLLGWDGESRRLLTCAVGGSLNTVSPTVCEIINKTSTGGNEDVTFSDLSTSEVMILADKANGGDVWVNVGAAGAVDTGWPLDAGEYVQLSVNNMRDLQMRIITSGDKVIILRTV